MARGEADLGVFYVLTADRYPHVRYLTQPVDINNFNLLIHPLPKSAYVSIFAPFDVASWLVGIAMFLACCCALAAFESNAFFGNVVDIVYALPFRQRDRKYRWRSRQSKILLLFYVLSAKVRPILCSIESVDSSVTMFMKILKNSR